jgi:hypothetical protein
VVPSDSSPRRIAVPPDWDDPSVYPTPWTEEYLRLMFGHEFGHGFGLGNNAACTLADTLMRGGLACGSAPPQGAALTPTSNDSVPVKNGTYGNTPAVSCP